MGLISIYAVVYKYPNAPADVMPEQPAGIALPAPTTAAPNSPNPRQP
jgi:succinate dehydrogenase / fumarate reductase cytochrome b subunit